MSYCLIPKLADQFKQRLIDGSIDPVKLEKATSEERRAFFSEFLGEQNAKNVNALFESKLLLKNKQAGWVTWAKTITGIKPQVRNDIIARVERLGNVLTPIEEKAFLADLAAKRLGIDVTAAEAQKISGAVKELDIAKAKIPESSPIGSSERLNYGIKKALFQEYFKGLKANANALSFKEWLMSPKAVLKTVTATTKSVLSSLDNSFFGRQGIKMFFTNPDIWMKSFLKSWGNIAKELGGHDAMLPIKADIYSRPNAINGKYKAGGYALDINSEEAFPTSLPGLIPGLGRLFKASESAFNGAALEMRSNYADRIIAKAEKAGVDTLDPKQAQGLGKLVNSMTGRGSIGKLDVIGEEINAAAFSIKFLKSNFDTLTAHVLDSKMSGFAKRQAALNLVKITAGVAAVLFTADQLHPGSVEWDPRSSNFGKIKYGKSTYDVTGGMGSLVTLAARLIPIKHNGKWAFYTKNSKGELVELSAKNKDGTPKFGAPTALDVIDNFWQGKLSPTAGFFRDMWKGTDYQGRDTSPSGIIKNPGPAVGNLITPLSIQAFEQLQKAESADTLATMILEALGINTNTNIPKKK